MFVDRKNITLFKIAAKIAGIDAFDINYALYKLIPRYEITLDTFENNTKVEELFVDKITLIENFLTEYNKNEHSKIDYEYFDMICNVNFTVQNVDLSLFV
jgi:hypothetical protein